jgi:hypothetical protein
MKVIKTCCADGKVNENLSQKLTILQLKFEYAIKLRLAKEGSVCMSMIEFRSGIMLKKHKMECMTPMFVFVFVFFANEYHDCD